MDAGAIGQFVFRRVHEDRMIDRAGLPLELHYAVAQHQGTMPTASKRERAYAGICSAAEPCSKPTHHETPPEDAPDRFPPKTLVCVEAAIQPPQQFARCRTVGILASILSSQGLLP
jgi:hypothetical protein